MVLQFRAKRYNAWIYWLAVVMVAVFGTQAADVLHKRGLLKVLVVTDGFHEDRSLAIATDVGLQAWPVPTPHSPITGWSTVPYFAKETVGVGVGRIFGYSHLHVLG